MQRSIATVNLWRKGPAFALLESRLSREPGYGPDDPAAKEPRRDTAGYPAEFGALLALVERVRRRLLINRLIGSWMVCLSWIFLGLIFAAALSRNLKYALRGGCGDRRARPRGSIRAGMGPAAFRVLLRARDGSRVGTFRPPLDGALFRVLRGVPTR